MAKAIRFANNTYLDDTSLSVDRKTLDNIINTHSINPNGYQLLPGGIIIQWGTVIIKGITINEYRETVTFSRAFNICFGVQVTMNDPGYGVTKPNVNIGVSSISNTAFELMVKRGDLYTASQDLTVKYFTIGI